MHAAVLETTPGLLVRAEYWRFRPPEVEKLMAAKARSTPLLVRVPEQADGEKLYFRPAQRASEPDPPPARPQSTREAPAPPADPASPAERPSALVLQPSSRSLPPETLPELKSFSVWSGPNPARAEAPITPGAPEPRREPAPSSTQASLETPVPAPPALPVTAPVLGPAARARVYLPPSGASPLASRRQWLQEPELLSAAHAGTPAAFVILTPERPKPGETITVPPGNLVVLGTGTGGASTAAPQPPAPAAAAAKPSEEPQTERSAAPATRPPAPNGRSAPLEPPREVARAAIPAAAKETRDTSAGAGTAAGRAGSAKTATRTIRTSAGDILAFMDSDGSMVLTYPEGGSFDVVVVDAVLPQPIAPHSTALSGSPVYTAYLNVGQTVEWVIHYCLPGGNRSASRQHAVVTLGAPKPLKAPYVVEAHLPPDPLWQGSEYQVFHAMLTSTGRLESLRALQAGQAGELLLDALRRWIFRPALMDGAPTATEVLLVIPPFRPGR